MLPLKHLLSFLLCIFLTAALPGMASAVLSSGLTQIRTDTETGYRLDYVDADGNKVLASDLGYASICYDTELPDSGEYSKIVTEMYFDEAGNPVALSSGQYGRIRYYTSNQETGKKELTRITYVDARGNPMKNASGIATLLRFFRNGHVIRVMYYDENDEQTSARYGQYGYRREFNENGQVSALTYLDKDGQTPFVCKGYDTIRYEYNDQGQVVYEWYERDGKPVCVMDSGYGLRKDYDQNGKLIRTTPVDLDRNGIFSIFRFLKDHLWITGLICFLVLCSAVFLSGKPRLILFILYVVFILYMTLLNRDSGTRVVDLRLFSSYSRILTSPARAAEIFSNILLFVPFGAMLSTMVSNSRAIMISMLFSALIEITQYIGSFGFCTLDDILSNTIGGAAGVVIMLLIVRFSSRSTHPSSGG